MRNLLSFVVLAPHVSPCTGCADSAGPTNLIEDSPVEQHMSLSSSLIQSQFITSLNLHMDEPLKITLHTKCYTWIYLGKEDKDFCQIPSFSLLLLIKIIKLLKLLK